MRGRYGEGSIFPRGGKPDENGKLKTGSWWICYSRNGVMHRESAQTLVKAEARALLKRRSAEIVTGVFIPPKDQRITVDDIYQLLLDDYKSKHRASLEGTQQRWEWQNPKCPEKPPTIGRLKKFFGGLRATQVTTDLLNKYVIQCQSAGLSDATINRDLAALKKAFNLAYRSTPRRIQEVSVFPHLKESTPRKGFVEEPQYRELCKHAAGQLWLRSMIAVAYTFGFRRSELLNMRCEQINLLDGTIRLWRGTTKSGEPRHVTLTVETKTLIAACVTGKQPSDYVFTRKDGQRIRDFREAWATLTKVAGVPDLLFHDLRRSAVRNLVRAGVPEQVAMSISGHKSRSVFDRYDITTDRDRAEAARKLEQYAQQISATSEQEDLKDMHKTYTIGHTSKSEEQLSN